MVKDEDEYADREVFNEALFDSKDKAVEYVEGKGYIFNDEYNEYQKPVKDGYRESYHIEEWEINQII